MTPDLLSGLLIGLAGVFVVIVDGMLLWLLNEARD